MCHPPGVPASAVHVPLGSESEIDEATAAAVSQSPNLRSLLNESRLFDSVSSIFGIPKDGLEDYVIPSNTAYIDEESRAKVVQEYPAQPEGKKFLEFGYIFLSGPCSRGEYDFRLDFMFCLIRSNDAYPDQTNLLRVKTTARVKCTGHPDETPRNLMTVLDLIKLFKRQDYLIVKQGHLAQWRRRSAMHKALHAFISHWWFPPLMLFDIAAMLRASEPLPFGEIAEETEEDRNRAVLNLTDHEIKVLTAADLY